jgi:hypothetical protein
MNEIELCEKLEESYKDLVKNQYNAIYIYYHELQDLETCDFELLQNLCENKGFHIYKANQSPINTTFYKKIWKQYKGIVLYSDISLTFIKHFDKKHPHSC